MVVFSVLEVVPSHYFDLAEVGILFPLNSLFEISLFSNLHRVTYIQEVDFLEQLLLVELELPNHVSDTLCTLRY